jgi:UDP-N-acetylglucosamine 2-epimerase (non-hydrolysing)
MIISVVIGTRPEIIKISPLLRRMVQEHLDHYVIHTGQHYSHNMDRIFFDELGLREPDYNLQVGSGTHAEETGKMMIEIEKVLKKIQSNLVLVLGDTNTALAGALSAVKLHIKIGHIEAGLRCYDRRTPEEVNRVVVDHVSDYLFAPTEVAVKNLIAESIMERSIFLTGNTIVDAVYENSKIAEEKSNILSKLNLKSKEYFLVTAHREENTNFKDKLSGIIEGLNLVANYFSTPIVFPIHPRTDNAIKKFNLKISDKICLIPPLGYLDFLKLLINSKLVLTDSGGIQEEACILKIPCGTLRESTERPETLTVGSNILVGTNPDKILEGVKYMIDKKPEWVNPFGDGKASEKIIKIINSLKV